MMFLLTSLKAATAYNMWQVDMYTRVKRERRHVKRDMYGIPINEDSKDKTASSGNSETESEFLQCW